MQVEEGWEPIETAPTTGAVVRVKNELMKRGVKAKFGIYKASWGTLYPDSWVLVEDDEEEYMPLPAGTLVCPTMWKTLT